MEVDYERTVGVGPHPLPWPMDSRFDPELLRDGDRRNVADGFRYWTVEAIVAELDRSRHDFHIAMENLEHDFNIGSVVRTANAFNASSVRLVGKRRWNRRGAMVTNRYLHVEYHDSPVSLGDWAAANDLPIIGIDNIPGSIPLETFALPRRCVMFFGQEGAGLSEEAQAQCTVVLDIAQFGSTRSINLGAAAAIAMHSWIRQHVFEQ
ncbi:MAG: TrmH family RNA methyltransferase [Actinomycetes bacterium]